MSAVPFSGFFCFVLVVLGCVGCEAFVFSCLGVCGITRGGVFGAWPSRNFLIPPLGPLPCAPRFFCCD